MRDKVVEINRTNFNEELETLLISKMKRLPRVKNFCSFLYVFLGWFNDQLHLLVVIHFSYLLWQSY